MLSYFELQNRMRVLLGICPAVMQCFRVFKLSTDLGGRTGSPPGPPGGGDPGGNLDPRISAPSRGHDGERPIDDELDDDDPGVAPGGPGGPGGGPDDGPGGPGDDTPGNQPSAPVANTVPTPKIKISRRDPFRPKTLPAGTLIQPLSGGPAANVARVLDSVQHGVGRLKDIYPSLPEVPSDF